MRRTHINIRCEHCGNALRVERANYDPSVAAEMVTSRCDRCDEGDFVSVWYFDSEGREILQHDDPDAYYAELKARLDERAPV